MSLAKKRKTNLPKNWIVVNSTSLPDRVYYFNVRTGKSSWEEPPLETDKPEASKPSSGQKRKLSAENDQPEVPAVTPPRPGSSGVEKTSRRKVLSVRRSAEVEKVTETPQMKAMRIKILDKKAKQSTSNDKRKPSTAIASTNNKKNSPLPVSKSSRNRVSKSRAGGDASCSAVSSQSGSSISGKRSEISSLSEVARGSRASGRRGKERFENVKLEASKNVNLKKNLANKRLDKLKKILSVEKKEIESPVGKKNEALRKADGNSKPSVVVLVKSGERLSSLKESLPNVYQNCDARYKSLRARLASRSSSSSNVEIGEEIEKVDVSAPKLPRIPKKIKTVEEIIDKVEESQIPDRNNPPSEINTLGDSFYEEMEWEPIEEEKVLVEIQEVRMHLSSGPGAAEQKLPDYAVNGLQLPRAPPNADKQIVYVVVDTNVFLSNLKAVTELLEDSQKSKGYRPVVVVPWMVLQELDYIKDNKSKTKSSQLQRSAKIAVDFLFQHFKSKHPRLQGQTSSDAAANRIKYQVESPDDEILQSCLQIRESGCTVVLLSNDKNLCNKAIVHDIQTYRSHECIQETISPVVKKSGGLGPAVKANPEPLKLNSEENRVLEVGKKEAEISDDIYGETKAIIKSFFSTIVSKEMEKLYGDNWKKYTIIQPPWSVIDVLKCASKHWIAAVGEVFLRQAEPLVKKLCEMFLNSSQYSVSLKSVGEVLDVCYDILQMVKSDNHRELAEKICCDIKGLIEISRHKLKEIEDEKVEEKLFFERENNNLNDELRAKNAFEFFENIWTFTNNFCGLSADLSGIPHSVSYKTFDPVPTPETLNRLQPDLVLRLQQLINALRRVLTEEDPLTPSHPALIELYHSLVNYLPNSGELNNTAVLDLIDLLCCINVKKEFLRTGLVQLQELGYQFCRIADYRSMTANVLN